MKNIALQKRETTFRVNFHFEDPMVAKWRKNQFKTLNTNCKPPIIKLTPWVFTLLFTFLWMVQIQICWLRNIWTKSKTYTSMYNLDDKSITLLSNSMTIWFTWVNQIKTRDKIDNAESLLSSQTLFHENSSKIDREYRKNSRSNSQPSMMIPRK